MSYQSISHARSNRVPFYGFGHAPGYMNGCAGCGDGIGADWGSAIAAGTQSAAEIVKTASGAYKQQERASRNALEAARLQSAAAAGDSAARVRIAEIEAETARMNAGRQPNESGSKTTMIVAAVGGVVVLGAIGYLLLKK